MDVPAGTTPVKVRECECPGKRHNGTGDVVYLRTKPNVALGLAVEGDVILAAGRGDMLKRAWAISYIREGVVGWNFLDAQGKPRPLNVDELLDDLDMGMVVAEKADELYGDRVVNPLLERLFQASTTEPETPSQPGPNDDSTSPIPASTPSPSGRSSRATSGASRRSKR